MDLREEAQAEVDAVVVGAGFGGLAAALRLCEGGASVLLCEALRYPGGCASTFTRGGRRYEAGATLFSGFGEGQLFTRWVEKHALAVRFERLDPMVELVAPGFSLAVSPSRDELAARMCALSPGHAAGIRAFFETQRRTADALWSLFEDPSLLPPFGWAQLAAHVARTPAYLPLAALIARPLETVLTRHRVHDCSVLRTFVDAVCQITVQTSSREAEAPFALAAMDYFFRGTGHVHGGIGALADGLVRALTSTGGAARFSCRVQRVTREGARLRVRTRRGDVLARHVVLNLLPHDARALLGRAPRENAALDALAARVETGWGAVLRYLVVRDEGLDASPRHLELVHDATRPFIEGNHVFCSISGRDETERAGAGFRTVTVSTHVREPGALCDRSERAAVRVEAVQRAMRATLEARAPWLEARVVDELTASPRTFERFVGRTGGYVGGVPRRAGLANYAGLWPTPIERGVWLVGDSVFPGQSTLATALSGVKVAEQILARG